MSSKSKAASTTSTSTLTSDSRVAADNGAIVVQDGDVNITDAGAFDLVEDVTGEAFDLAQGVAELGAEFALDALGFVTKNQTQTNEIIEQVLEQNQEASTQLGSQLIRLGIPAIALIIIVRGWK